MSREDKRELRRERRAERREGREASPLQLFRRLTSLLGLAVNFDQVKAWARVEVCRIAESCEGGEVTSRAEILDELSQELATCLDDFVSWPFGKVGKVIDQLDDHLWLAFARFILRPIVNELFPEDDAVWVEAGASV